MSITASTLVAVESPASKDDLWIPPALFLHDWGDGRGCALRTQWTTAVANMRSAGEVRSGLTPKPSRSLDVSWLAMDQEELALLRSVLGRLTMARTPVPLVSEQTALTATATAGATFVACDTTQRRFLAGGRAAIWPASAGNVARRFDLAVITGVAAGSLTLGSALTHDYAAGAMAAPVMEADLVSEPSASYLSDSRLRVQLTFRESVGAMTLDPWRALGSMPEGTGSYGGLPILGIASDWGNGGNSGGASRLAETTQVGLVNYTEVHGSRFKATQTMDVLALDRSGAAAVAGFFDAMGGRLGAFLAVNLTSDFAMATAPLEGDTTLSLAAMGPLLDWAWRTHVAIVLADDTLIVRAIDGTVTRDGDVDTVPLAEALGALGAGVTRVAGAFIARFATDELEELWHTDRALAVRLPAIEALREADYELAHMPAAPSGMRRGRTPLPAGAGGGAAYFPYRIRLVINDPGLGGEKTIICRWRDTYPADNSGTQSAEFPGWDGAGLAPAGYAFVAGQAYLWESETDDGQLVLIQPWQFLPYDDAPSPGDPWSADAEFYSILYYSDGNYLNFGYWTADRTANGAPDLSNADAWTKRPWFGLAPEDSGAELLEVQGLDFFALT